MSNAKTAPNSKPYFYIKIDLILFEAMSLTAHGEAASDMSFDWLLEYSQISLGELA